MALPLSFLNTRPDAAEPAAEIVLTLLNQRWPRLAAEYDHPLSVLYQSEQQPLQQWTLGWGIPSSENPLGALYLLVWQADRFQQAGWQLYQDGRRLLDIPDQDGSALAQHCRSLLEGRELPVIQPVDVLRRLTDYGVAPDLRETAACLLEQTFIERPFVFQHFKPALLTLLAEDLDNPLWPTLDILKLHRLSGKTPVVRLLKAALERGEVFSAGERRRVQELLNGLQAQYELLGHELHPLFLSPYGEAYQGFRRLLTEGLWWVRLNRAEAPN